MRLLLGLVLLSAAAFPQEPEHKTPMRMPEPKNLKLLEPANLIPTMRAFTVALGAKCTFCHVEGDFASDDNPKKEIARHMIVMARDINAKYFEGHMRVMCYTCHRGAHEPPEGAPAPAEHPGPPPGATEPH
jgi:hypothetical protein